MNLKKIAILSSVFIVVLILVAGALLIYPSAKTFYNNKLTSIMHIINPNKKNVDVSSTSPKANAPQIQNSENSQKSLQDAMTMAPVQSSISTDKESASQQSSSNPLPQKQNGNASVPEEVNNKVNSIANKVVETEDLIKVAGILVSKLTISEINFLFEQTDNDYWINTPVKDIEYARSILFSKLDSTELESLRTLGKKYGRSMEILRKDIDVASIKELQIKSKNKVR